MHAAAATRVWSHRGRWIAFYSVGALGMGVQLLTAWLLSGWGGMHYLAATALAVEVSVLHNFLWHERWTWADRTASVHRSGRPAAAVLRRMARFHLANGLVSVSGNVACTGLLVTVVGTSYLVGTVLAIAACSIVNFAAADRLVFVTEA